jgi:hypothetical protein
VFFPAFNCRKINQRLNYRQIQYNFLPWGLEVFDVSAFLLLHGEASPSISIKSLAYALRISNVETSPPRLAAFNLAKRKTTSINLISRAFPLLDFGARNTAHKTSSRFSINFYSFEDSNSHRKGSEINLRPS